MLDINKDDTLDVYTQIHNVYDVSKSYYYDDYAYNPSTPHPLTLFAGGNYLFAIDILGHSEIYLTDMNDDYYIIPCPMLNENQVENVGYASALADCVTLYMLPYTQTNVAATTATLELMASESYKLVTPAYYDTALKTRYVRGDVNAASEMIDMTRESMYFDFIQLYSQRVNLITVWYRGDFLSLKSKAVMSNLEKKSRSFNLSLEKLLEDMANARNIKK